MGSRARRAAASLAVLAAGLVGGGVTLGLVPAAVLPAAGAATCTSAGGVSVVVDFRELGGSTLTSCAPDGGGKSAAEVFASVGVSISYATRQSGFVCRVQGVPAGDPCVNASPANAYWGLWWSDGASGSWTYSSSGVGGLIVPAGGSVGWSWQQDRGGSGTVAPAIAPPVAASTPAPSATPTPTSSPSSPATPTPTGGTSGGNGGSGGDDGKGGNGGKDGKGGKDGSSPTPSPTPSASPSGTPSATSEPTLAPESPGDSSASATPADPSEDPTLAAESPGDSPASEDAEASASPSESPSDSASSTATEAGPPTPDEPARVPAALTWGVLGLLAVAIAGSLVVARRRRGPDAS